MGSFCILIAFSKLLGFL